MTGTTFDTGVFDMAVFDDGVRFLRAMLPSALLINGALATASEEITPSDLPSSVTITPASLAGMVSVSDAAVPAELSWN